MSMTGMNVDEVRRIGARLGEEARQLEQLQRAIDAIVQEARRHWGGPDLERFAQLWSGRSRLEIGRAAAGLGGLQDDVVRNAAEQEVASSAGGSPFAVENPAASALAALLRQVDVGAAGPRIVLNPETGRYEFGSVAADVVSAEVARHWSQSVGGSAASADSSMSLGAHGSASASIGTDGLIAGGALFVGYMATAGVTAGAGPLAVTASGTVRAGVEADAGIRLTTTDAQAHVGGFVGGRATGEISAEVGGVKTGLQAEAWAGMGVAADADIGFHDGQVHIKFGAGAALGVGAKIEPEISIDVNKVAHEINDAGRSANRMWRQIVEGL